MAVPFTLAREMIECCNHASVCNKNGKAKSNITLIALFPLYPRSSLPLCHM
jgi:hypothetical protein